MKKVLLLIPAILLVVGCSTNKASNESNGDSGSIDSSSTEISSSSSEETLNTRDITITLKNSTYSDGGQNLSNAKPSQEFTALMNKDLDIMKGFDSANCYFQPTSTEKTPITVCVGTKGGAGLLNIEFNYKITKIKAVLQPYYKQYINNGQEYLNVETTSYLAIGTTGFDLSVTDTSVVPSEVNKEVSFSSPVTEISFSNENSNQRTFINEMTLTYVVE